MKIYSVKYFCFISVPAFFNTFISISHLSSGMHCMASCLIVYWSTMNPLNQFSLYIYIQYLCVCMYVCIYVFPPGPHHILRSSNLQYSCQYALHRQTIAASWRNLRCTRIPHWPGVVLLVKLKGQKSHQKKQPKTKCCAGCWFLIKIKKLQPDSADSLITSTSPNKMGPQ